MKVEHPNYPELGVGEVLSEQDGKSTVQFRSGKVVKVIVFPAAELTAVVQKPARVMWKDAVTGESFFARKDFIERLPSILRVGKDNILSVRKLLEALGGDYSNDNNGNIFSSDSRQLRDAKEYLISEKGLPIVSVQSQVGGYYLADNPEDLLKNAAIFRAQAAGLIGSAEALESVALRLASEGKNVETSV